MLFGNRGVKCSENTHPDKSGSDDDLAKLALRALCRLLQQNKNDVNDEKQANKQSFIAILEFFYLFRHVIDQTMCIEENFVMRKAYYFMHDSA